MMSLIDHHVTRCRDGKGHKCERNGIIRLIAPDGLPVPGALMCRVHAKECVQEYSEKLGEEWLMLNVLTLGFESAK